MAPQASKKRGFLPPDHQHIGIASCTSIGIDSEQAPGTVHVFKELPRWRIRFVKRMGLRIPLATYIKWPQRRHREGTSSSHQTWRERYEKVEGSLRGRDVDAGRLVVLFQPASAIGDPVSK